MFKVLLSLDDLAFVVMPMIVLDFKLKINCYANGENHYLALYIILLQKYSFVKELLIYKK